MRPGGISVHVEHLVLDGIPVAADDGELVGGAVRAGLTRLLAAHATALQAWPHTVPPTLQAPVVTVPASGEPALLGDAIALAVHQGMRDARGPQRPGGGGAES